MTSKGPTIGTYADAIEYLQKSAVYIPPDLEQRAAAMVSWPSLLHFGPTTSGTEIAAMWLNLLNANSDDLLARITLLLVLDGCIHPNDSRWRDIDNALQERQTLAGKPMRAYGTSFEIKRRLAGNLFDFARRGKVSDSNRGLLQETVARFDELLARDRAADVRKVRLKYVGMRGVAHKLLARGDPNPTRHNELACRDLEESRLLGDHSAEHDQYLVEAYLKRLDAVGDLSFLDRAQVILDEALQRHPRARGLLTQHGEVLLRRGMLLSKTPEAEETARCFAAAVERFETALRSAPHQSFSDEYIRLKRGMARFRFYLASSKVGTVHPTLLDAAIIDLDQTAARAQGNDSGLSLPWALATRAQLYASDTNFDLAISDLHRASSLADSLPAAASTEQLRDVIRVRLADARLNAVTGSEDVDQISRVATEIMDWAAADSWLVGPLTRAGRVLLKHGASDVACITRIANFAESVAYNPAIDEAPRAFAAAHGASLLHLISRAKGTDSLLPRAHQLFSHALAMSNEGPPEWWGFAGEVALRLAKTRLAAGSDAEAIHYLEDASVWFSAGIQSARGLEGEETSFRFREAYSKLGEAQVRLHGLTGIEAHAEAAMSALRESIALGNDTSQVFGLLADAYYRRGRARGSLDDLREARSLKARARQAVSDVTSEGAAWRENLSVSAAISLRIFRLTNDPADLVDAVIMARDATRADASWPWPLFQLGDLASEVRSTTLRSVLEVQAGDELVQLVGDGDSAELNRRACMLAIQNPLNFDQKILGGRQKVYVLRDPHRLMSESFVFKPTFKNDALREIQAIAEFRDFLTRTSAPRTFRLPVPLMILESEEPPNVTYAMRRSEGVQLGTFVLRTIRTTHAVPIELLNATVAYLAHYHAWRVSDSARAPSRDPLERVFSTIRRFWSATFGPGTARELLTRLRVATAADLPLLSKKDAHPENWLVTQRGEVVMLDLEAQASLPLMFEVAQFLEDYPIFDCSSEGWGSRHAIIDHYLSALSRLAPEFRIPPASICRAAYESYALVRAAFGIGHTRPSQSLTSSSSVLLAVAARQKHYISLSQYLATHGSNAQTRDVASYIARAAVERASRANAAVVVRSDDPMEIWLGESV